MLLLAWSFSHAFLMLPFWCFTGGTCDFLVLVREIAHSVSKVDGGSCIASQRHKPSMGGKMKVCYVLDALLLAPCLRWRN